LSLASHPSYLFLIYISHNMPVLLPIEGKSRA
jgi:hypothetical protein